MWILERSFVSWIEITFVGTVTNVLFLGWLNNLAVEAIKDPVAKLGFFFWRPGRVIRIQWPRLTEIICVTKFGVMYCRYIYCSSLYNCPR